MVDYYIKSISLTGDEVKTAVVNFQRGLNIVYGPSNTGKSYIIECINYMFGSQAKTFRIGTDTGYNCVEMLVISSKGEIFLKRPFGDSNIYVESYNSDIESGKYSTGKGKLHINNLWLYLMDIDIPSGIIKNASCQRNNLTVRTFLHMFLIEEDNIIQKDSILFQRSGYSKTAILSTLLYLITGNSFEDNEEFDEKSVKKAKKTAVIEYINDSLSDLASLKNQLSDFEYSSLGFIEETIEHLLGEIDSSESTLSKAVKRSKSLSSEIYDLNNQIAECNMLYNRYQVLEEQYISDINRLTFIVEGEVHKPQYVEDTLCPFCNGEIEKEYQGSCVEAAAIELKKIMLQLNDLNDAEEDIYREKNSLEEKNNILQMERSELEKVINSELKPKIKHLRKLLSMYRKTMEVQSQIKTIRHLEHNMIHDLNAFEMKDEKEVMYKPKEHFDFLILQGISTILENILEECNFDNLSSAYFSKDTFDVVVNGKEKSKFGQGYRAFLNTVVALTLMKYLKECGTYSPGILIVDSPILSLKEKKAEQASDNMKESLFRYMLNNQDNGQMIIVENEIPELDYENANTIHFTKDMDDGRYGLLYGLTE